MVDVTHGSRPSWCLQRSACLMSDPSTSGSRVARAALDLFAALPANGKPQQTSARRECTVLAAFVAEIRPSSAEGESEWRVLALGTGTKALGRGQVDARGTNIADGHAEVIARRALILYLLVWARALLVDRHCELDPAAPFLRRPAAQPPLAPLALKPSWSVHLFISDPPCGDASIYSRAGGGTTFTGARPVEGGREETQRLGAMRGKCARSDASDAQRSSSMSCSDKILRWYHTTPHRTTVCEALTPSAAGHRRYLGLQGSLLHSLCGSVMLSSVSVARDPAASPLAQRAALTRALDARCAPSSPHSGPPPLPLELSVVEETFSSGKTATEALLALEPAAGGGGDRNSKRRKVRAGYPCGWSVNWVRTDDSAGALGWRRCVASQGGSVEVVAAGSGLLQGAGRARARDADLPLGCQSRLCRFEMTRAFALLFGAANPGALGRQCSLAQLKLSGEEYRARRREMLAAPVFREYAVDDEDTYSSVVVTDLAPHIGPAAVE